MSLYKAYPVSDFDCIWLEDEIFAKSAPSEVVFHVTVQVGHMVAGFSPMLIHWFAAVDTSCAALVEIHPHEAYVLVDDLLIAFVADEVFLLKAVLAESLVPGLVVAPPGIFAF